MSISQFFILSSRGDTIIYRDFRRDIKKGTSEVFFRKVKFWNEDGAETAPPIFNIDGINYISIKKFELYFVMTSKENFSVSYYLEVLQKIMGVIKDHCGLLTEESIRKNFILCYEILDELIDFGIPQLSSTTQVLPFVFTDPISVTNEKITTSGIFSKTAISSNATTTPISQNFTSENNLFVDLLEKITILFNAKGSVINSSIDGCIQMKSYLKKSPQVRLQLSPDLSIGSSGYGSTLKLDDCIFHPSMELREFESDKVLTFIPPDGEFSAMFYRISQDFPAPFRIISTFENTNYKLEYRIRIQANFPAEFFTDAFYVKFSVPKTSEKVTFDNEGSKTKMSHSYSENEKKCHWIIKKFVGGTEESLITRITLPIQNTVEKNKEIGPVSLNFEISKYTISKIEIKDLKITSTEKKYEAARWVRHVTQANSYVARAS